MLQKKHYGRPVGHRVQNNWQSKDYHEFSEVHANTDFEFQQSSLPSRCHKCSKHLLRIKEECIFWSYAIETILNIIYQFNEDKGCNFRRYSGDIEQAVDCTSYEKGNKIRLPSCTCYRDCPTIFDFKTILVHRGMAAIACTSQMNIFQKVIHYRKSRIFL